MHHLTPLPIAHPLPIQILLYLARLVWLGDKLQQILLGAAFPENSVKHSECILPFLYHTYKFVLKSHWHFVVVLTDMLDLHGHVDQACHSTSQQVAIVIHDKPQLTLFVVVLHALLIGPLL